MSSILFQPFRLAQCLRYKAWIDRHSKSHPSVTSSLLFLGGRVTIPAKFKLSHYRRSSSNARVLSNSFDKAIDRGLRRDAWIRDAGGGLAAGTAIDGF